MQLSVLWRDNWHLLSLLGVVLIILSVGMLRSLGSGGSGEMQAQASEQMVTGDASGTPRRQNERLLEILEREPGPFPPDEDSQTLETIVTHQASFDADPDATDAPNYLLAIANLQMYRLENYEEAAQFYELLLYNYPDWEKTPTVYDKLWACYEMLEDYTSIVHLAQLIQERHPEEDSDDYQLAQEMLGQSFEDEDAALEEFSTAGQ